MTTRLRIIALEWLLSGLAALPLRWSRALGRCLGRRLAATRIEAARITRRNLALALPHLDPAARTALARESLSHTAELCAETPWLWRASAPAFRQQIIAVSGEDLLDDEQGCLILGGHCGNWELLNIYLAQRAAEKGRVYLGLYDATAPPAARLWAQRRCRHGHHLPMDQAGLRRALSLLRGGGWVGLLVDQVPDKTAAVEAPFFGRPALTATLPRRLLQRSQARAVFAAALRRGHGFAMSFELLRGADDDDPIRAASILNMHIEALVRAAPEQYLWAYKRYKLTEGPDAYR